MQDSAPSRGPANYVPSPIMQSIQSRVLVRLGVAQRQAGRTPRIEPEGRRRQAAPGMLEHRLVDGHVPITVRRLIENKPPYVAHAVIIPVAEAA